MLPRISFARRPRTSRTSRSACSESVDGSYDLNDLGDKANSDNADVSDPAKAELDQFEADLVACDPDGVTRTSDPLQRNVCGLDTKRYIRRCFSPDLGAASAAGAAAFFLGRWHTDRWCSVGLLLANDGG